MKTLIACCVSLILLSSNIWAQQTDEDIRKVVKELETAYNTCDGDLLDSLMHPEFNHFTDQGAVDSLDPTSLCEGGYSFDLNFKIVDISKTEHMAIVLYHGSGFFIPAEGEKVPQNRKASSVLIKEEGEWVIKHSHNSPISK